MTRLEEARKKYGYGGSDASPSGVTEQEQKFARIRAEEAQSELEKGVRNLENQANTYIGMAQSGKIGATDYGKAAEAVRLQGEDLKKAAAKYGYTGADSFTEQIGGAMAAATPKAPLAPEKFDPTPGKGWRDPFSSEAEARLAYITAGLTDDGSVGADRISEGEARRRIAKSGPMKAPAVADVNLQKAQALAAEMNARSILPDRAGMFYSPQEISDMILNGKTSPRKQYSALDFLPSPYADEASAERGDISEGEARKRLNAISHAGTGGKFTPAAGLEALKRKNMGDLQYALFERAPEIADLAMDKFAAGTGRALAGIADAGIGLGKAIYGAVKPTGAPLIEDPLKADYSWREPGDGETMKRIGESVLGAVKNYKASEARYYRSGNTVTDRYNEDEWVKHISDQEAAAELNGFEKVVVDLADTFGYQMPTMLLSGMTGATGMTANLMTVGTFGSAAYADSKREILNEKNADGSYKYTEAQADLMARWSFLVEGVGETLLGDAFGVVPMVGAKLGGSVLASLGNPIVKGMVSFLWESNEEGLEEIAQDVLEKAGRKFILGEDFVLDPKELGYEYLLGSLSGGVMGSLGLKQKIEAYRNVHASDVDFINNVAENAAAVTNAEDAQGMIRGLERERWAIMMSDKSGIEDGTSRAEFMGSALAEIETKLAEKFGIADAVTSEADMAAAKPGFIERTMADVEADGARGYIDAFRPRTQAEYDAEASRRAAAKTGEARPGWFERNGETETVAPAQNAAAGPAVQNAAQNVQNVAQNEQNAEQNVQNVAQNEQNAEQNGQNAEQSPFIRSEEDAAAEVEYDRAAADYRAPATADAEETARTGREAGASAGQIAAAQEMSSVFGRRIVFFDGAVGDNGYFEEADGSIHLNVNSARTVWSVCASEMLHAIQTTESGKTFIAYANDHIAAADAQGRSYGQIFAQKKATYERMMGKELSDEYIRQEIADEFAGRYLFSSLEEIRGLAQGQPKAFRRVRQVISGWIQHFKPESRIAQAIYSDLERARDLYAQAAKEVGAAKTDAAETRHSYSGVNADGIEVYETSSKTKALTWKERVKQFENRLVNEYAGRTAKFVRNGHVYYAEIDRTNPVKSLYGDFHFSTGGKKAYIKSGADGDFFNLIENAEYADSAKDIKNHKSKDRFTDYFDYFVKTVQIDGKVYDLNATVKKQYGNSDGFTYTLYLKDNKKIKASPAVTEKDGLRVAGNASADSISQSGANSQPLSENSSDENRHSLEDDADEIYLSAVETGDTETAARLVKAAAKRAGYDSPMLYHGTKSFGFTEFDLSKMDDKRSIFLTDKPEVAATYSGADGVRRISTAAADVDAMSASETADALNDYSERYGDGLESKYTFIPAEDAARISSDADAALNELSGLVRSKIAEYADRMAEDFNDADMKVHERLVDLQEKIYLGSRDQLLTPLYLLINHTDAFSGSDVAADALRKLTIEREVGKRNFDTSDGFILRDELGGYVYVPMTVEEAKDVLRDYNDRGNYSLVAKTGRALEVDAGGQRWNELRNWMKSPLYSVDNTFVEKDGGKAYLIDRSTEDVIASTDVDGGKAQLEDFSIHALLVSKANLIMRTDASMIRDTRGVSEWAQWHGYDSVVFRNLIDNGGNADFDAAEMQSDVYVIFDPTAVKSADPVTYDDDGNVIPLSERFNPEEKDIRHSYEDAEYFDDERITENRERLLTMDSVANLSGNEFSKSKIDLITQVERYFEKVGGETENPRIGVVQLERSGIKSDIAHGIGRRKAAAFYAVPEVISRGMVIDYRQNWKDRGYDTAIIAAPITIDSETYYEGCVVTRASGKNKFYLHEVAQIKKDGTSPFKTESLRRDLSGDVPSVISLLQNLAGVNSDNENSSKNNRHSYEDEVIDRWRDDLESSPMRETTRRLEQEPISADEYERRTQRAIESESAPELTDEDAPPEIYGNYEEAIRQDVQEDVPVWAKNIRTGSTVREEVRKEDKISAELINESVKLLEDDFGLDRGTISGLTERYGREPVKLGELAAGMMFGATDLEMIPQVGRLAAEAAAVKMAKRKAAIWEYVYDWHRAPTAPADILYEGMPELQNQAKATLDRVISRTIERNAMTADEVKRARQMAAGERDFSHFAPEVDSNRAGKIAHLAEMIATRNYLDGHVPEQAALMKLGVRINAPLVHDYTSARAVVGAEKYHQAAEKEIKKFNKGLDADERVLINRYAEIVADGLSVPESFGDLTEVQQKRVAQLAKLIVQSRSFGATGASAQKSRVTEEYKKVLSGIIEDPTAVKKRSAIRLNANTMLRNNLAVFGEQVGGQINEVMFKPIMQNEAERMRFVNREVGEFRELFGQLSSDESAVLQMMIESEIGVANLGRVDVREALGAFYAEHNSAKSAKKNAERKASGAEKAAKTAEEKAAAKEAQMAELLSEVGKMDLEKLARAADYMRSKYAVFYDAINDFLVMHGYKPIGFIKNYAPHMQENDVRKTLSGYMSRLGFGEDVFTLPTEIAGRTETFRPGKKWNRHFQSRFGKATELDALGGYDSYIAGMSEVLYHTDDIQKLRTYSEYLRSAFASDQIHGEIDELYRKMRSGEISTEEAEVQIEEKLKEAANNTELSSYVAVLDDYTNVIAGKQTALDRGFEKLAGRKLLNASKKMQSLFVQSSIVGNVSSCINQTVQLPMVYAECGTKAMAQAFGDLFSGRLNAATSFDNESVFLTGKRGIDKLTDSSRFEKIIEGGMVPFETVDDVASRLIVRAKYFQMINEGIEHEEALKLADEYADSVVGSRMKGAKPLLFYSKNFLTSLVTTFQLEVANAWAHIDQDLPAQYRALAAKKGKAAAQKSVAAMLAKYLLSAFLLDRLFEELYGQTPVQFDLIGIFADSVASGFGMSQNTMWKNLLSGSFEKFDGFSLEGAAEETKDEVVDDLPYVSTLSAMLGFSDSRLPLPTLWDDDIKKGIQEANPGRLADGLWTVGKSLIPFGNQLNKTVKGASHWINAGSYNASGKLQYAAGSNMFDNVTGLIFGQQAFYENADYWASGGQALSEKGTAAYKSLIADGMNHDKAYELVRMLNSVSGDEQIAAGTAAGDSKAFTMLKDEYFADAGIEPAEMKKKEKQVIILDTSDLTDAQRLTAYKAIVAGEKEAETIAGLEDAGEDSKVIYETILGSGGAENSAEKREKIMNSDLSGQSKAEMYYMASGSENEKECMDQLIENGADAGMVAEVMSAISSAEKTADKVSVILESDFTALEMETAYMYRVVSKSNREKAQAKLDKVIDAGGNIIDYLEAYRAVSGATWTSGESLAKAKAYKKAIDRATKKPAVRKALYEIFEVSEKVW